MAESNGMLREIRDDIKELLKITSEHRGEIRWHGYAIRGLIAAVAGLAIAAIGHMLGIR